MLSECGRRQTSGGKFVSSLSLSIENQGEITFRISNLFQDKVEIMTFVSYIKVLLLQFRSSLNVRTAGTGAIKNLVARHKKTLSKHCQTCPGRRQQISRFGMNTLHCQSKNNILNFVSLSVNKNLKYLFSKMCSDLWEACIRFQRHSIAAKLATRGQKVAKFVPTTENS